MTERLSPHDKRLLLRYQKLLTRFSTAPSLTSLGEIAEILYCTPRYSRSLLGDMQQSGWLFWTPRSGRGGGGVLQCRLDDAALQALLDGIYAMQTEQVNVSTPSASVNAAEGEHFTIQFFRPLMKITPSLYAAWPERHLIQMVHVGLMRFVSESHAPQPGIAHTTEVSSNGLTWFLHLRKGLIWHNGEPVKPEQLLPILEHHIGGPGLPHVAQVSLTGYTLKIQLSTPDILLPQRLAHPAYALSHPENDAIGLGPFRISEHSASTLTLQRSPYWYGENPHAAEVRFDIIHRPAPDWSVITLNSVPPPASPVNLRNFSGTGGYTFLAFNTTRENVTKKQQAIIRRIVQGIAQDMLKATTTITECPEWLQSRIGDVEPAELPPELNVVYCRMSETAVLINQLKKSLQWRGCRLNITTRAASHWLLPGEEWSKFDFCVGFQPVWKHQPGKLEDHYRYCPLFREFWGAASHERGKQILAKAVKKSYHQYSRWIWRLNTYLITREWITPLYAQRWQLQAPAHIRGVRTTDLGWPDFTKLWISSPL